MDRSSDVRWSDAGAEPEYRPLFIRLAQEALENVNRKPGTPLPSWSQLSGLAQLTVEINFEYNSVAIVPESYRNVGLIAYALHHPLLLPYKFLIVGHTDGTGGAQYNLTLSQQRADAIKEALSTTFAVDPRRLFTVGVGMEQPIDASNPDAAVNRRVQLINIGMVK